LRFSSLDITIERRSRTDDFERLTGLVREHEVTLVVVGLPLGMDGSRGERVRLTELFMERVRKATGALRVRRVRLVPLALVANP